MKTNPFNICPTCTFRETCVLTDQKSQVWSCSEYEEKTAETAIEITPMNSKKTEPEMAMA